MLVLSVLCGAGTAGAQQHIESVGQWKNPVGASVGSLINDRLWVRVRAKSRARAKVRTSALAKAPTKRINPAAPAAPAPPVADTEVTSSKTSPQVDAAVRFRPSGTPLRTQAIADLLSGNADPETKKQTFTLVSALLTEYEKAARVQGQPNDLALAVTVALVYNDCIYNGKPEPSDEKIMALRDALAELIAEKGIFTPFSDLQKQELYENLVITTLLAKVGYEETKKSGDTTSMAAYRGLAGITLQAVSGMQPDKVNLAGALQGPIEE
jgi:hypothetical protein